MGKINSRKMKVLQINAVANTNSTGRIAEEIGKMLIREGHECFMAYGRSANKSNLELIKIGRNFDFYVHGVFTLLTDKHGFGSRRATKEFIKKVENRGFDLVVLHNLHGYFINIEVLFEWLDREGVPVVWTLYDCWAFTGHCTYFDDISCEKWRTHCSKCPKNNYYPKSYVDSSSVNFDMKKRIFNSVKGLKIVVHSNWLKELVKESYLRNFEVHVTPSAIDLDRFKPIDSELRRTFGIGSKQLLLGCASVWTKRKGLDHFIELHSMLNFSEYQIVLIGLSKSQLKTIPSNIIGISRTESIEELAQWYSAADVFLNLTTQDNFPTTNLEALACGTPVITYDTGGSPEAIDVETGMVVTKCDLIGIVKAIRELERKNRMELSMKCRARAEALFSSKNRYKDYLTIFEDVIAVADV